MTLAILVTAHQHPTHLARLASRLDSTCSKVFVHVDAKSDESAFRQATDASFIESRCRVYWGGWSQVQATLNLVRAAISGPFTHFAFISGVDYPLARPEAILSYVAGTGLEHINCLPLPAPQVDKPLTRLSVRCLEGGYRERSIKGLSLRVFNKVLAALPQRDVERDLGPLKPFGGSSWWILTREAVEAALAVADEDSAAMRMFKTSVSPDESFFQTVIASRLGTHRIARACTYTDWSGPEPPVVLTDKHVEMLTEPGFELNDHYGSGPCLFARKAPVHRPDLLERLDAFAEARPPIRP
jgi:hypothetical protein